MAPFYTKTSIKIISIIITGVFLCASLGYPADNLRVPMGEIGRATAAINQISSHIAERFNEDKNRELSRLIISRLPFTAPTLGSSYSTMPLEYNGAIYPVEYWFAQGPDNRQDLAYMRIGYLFFLDESYYQLLPDSTRQALGPNLILLKDFQGTQLTPIFHTALTIITMMHEDLRKKHVIDIGSGAGMLSLVAWKLGAESFDLIDIDAGILNVAEENFKVNSEKEGVKIKYKVIPKDMYFDFHGILNEITPTELEIAVVSNIGYWPKAYQVSNLHSIGLIESLMQKKKSPKVRLFIAGGNCFFDITPPVSLWPRDPKRVIQEHKALMQRLGFRVMDGAFTEVVPTRSNWLMRLFAKVDEDNPPKFLVWTAVFNPNNRAELRNVLSLGREIDRKDL